MKSLQKKVRDRKTDIYILYRVSKDRRLGKWKTLFLSLIIGYLISPIDLIPDFIPILGQLDDLIVVTLGFIIAHRIIPHQIWEEHRKAAEVEKITPIPRGKKIAILIIFIWLFGILIIFSFLLSLLQR